MYQKDLRLGRQCLENTFSEPEMKELIKLDVVSKTTSPTITYISDFKVQISNCSTLTETRELMIVNHVTLDIIGRMWI